MPELKKIAARSGEPGLAYATDEDTRGIDPDPHSTCGSTWRTTWSSTPTPQAKLVAELLPEVVDGCTEEGDDYQQARRAFNVLLSTHGQAMFFASRYVGGLYVSRSHKGDKDAPEPFAVVDADKQREALTLLEEQVFSDKPFNFPPELYNHLAPTALEPLGRTMSWTGPTTRCTR